MSKSGSNRVKRGGNWNNSGNNLRCANRNNNNPANRNNNLGFRPWRDRSSGFALRYDPVCSTGWSQTRGLLRAHAAWARQEFRFFYGKTGRFCASPDTFPARRAVSPAANKLYFSLLWYCHGKAERDFISGRKMAYEIINIPLSSGSKTFNTDDVNKFCANKKSIARKVEFFQQEGSVIKSCVAGGRKPRKTKIYHPLLLLKTAIS